MSQPTFIPAPFFLLRTACSPIQQSEDLLHQQNWVEATFDLFASDESLRESLLIASPSLYRSFQEKRSKDHEKIAASLLKYALRSGTRTTPFGLFSFVATGDWGAHTTISFETDQIGKRARIDMEWVYSYLEKLYSDKRNLETLLVRTNPLLQEHKERFFLHHLRHGEKKENRPSKSVSVRNNKLTKAILIAAEYSITVEDLCTFLSKSLPRLDKQKTVEVIGELLSQQILLPGLFPSLLYPIFGKHSFSLEGTGIEQIMGEINDYNTLPIGSGEGSLLQIQQELNTVASSTNCLQVDAFCKDGRFVLSENVLREAEEAAEIIWKMTAPLSRFDRLIQYHGRFIEKYGTDRVVLLLELLSKDKGLGSFIEPMPSDTKLEPPPFLSRWERWLMREWQECLALGKEEVVITKDTLNQIAQNQSIDPYLAPLSFDLFFKILARSPSDIDQGLFTLLFSQPTSKGGSTIGRFLDILSHETSQHLKQYYEQEEALEPETMFVELSFWPTTPRGANVAIQPCFRSFNLDLESKESSSINLEDVYVGATPKELYLTLKDGSKELLFRTGNLLTPAQAPEPLRFLMELSDSKFQLLRPFFWGKVGEGAVFLPRVRFKKTILSPATWRCEAELFSKKTVQQIIELFIAWADKWKLPERFFITKLDYQLLQDRRHPAHLHEIASKLKKGESLEFTEASDTPWVTSEKGSHISEIVIPFLKNPIYKRRNKSFEPSAYQAVSYEQRWMTPGSEWYYIKLYLPEERMDSFLIHHVDPFLDEMIQSGRIAAWFFVRYNDPAPHLRIRAKLNSTTAFSSEFNKKGSAWMKEGLIQHLMVACYEREVERYGGVHLIEEAEDLFCANTRSVIRGLRAFMTRNFEFDDLSFQIMSLLCFLKNFMLEPEIAIAFLEVGKEHQAALKGYRGHKNSLSVLAQELEGYIHPSSGIDRLKEIFGDSRRAQEQYVLKAQDLLSTHHLYSIYDSFLHMHCNRIGCRGDDELRVRVYAHQTMRHLHYLSSAPTLANQ